MGRCRRPKSMTDSGGSRVVREADSKRKGWGLPPPPLHQSDSCAILRVSGYRTTKFPLTQQAAADAVSLWQWVQIDR
jgi:hypothetical protein